MIKQINYQNILVTPFLAKKEWSLSNIDPDNNCITEDYVGGYYVGGETTALDYVDYDNGGEISSNQQDKIREQRAIKKQLEADVGMGVFEDE